MECSEYSWAVSPVTKRHSSRVLSLYILLLYILQKYGIRRQTSLFAQHHMKGFSILWSFNETNMTKFESILFISIDILLFIYSFINLHYIYFYFRNIILRDKSFMNAITTTKRDIWSSIFIIVSEICLCILTKSNTIIRIDSSFVYVSFKCYTTIWALPHIWASQTSWSGVCFTISNTNTRSAH